MPNQYTHPSLDARFWGKVDRSGGPAACWPWTGHLDGGGYGRFKYEGSARKAHRIAWFIARGAWPAVHCLHSCDVRACCNPLHLFEGTNRENIDDKVAKGRQARGEGSGRAILTRAQVDELRAIWTPQRWWHRTGPTMAELASEYGLPVSAVQGALQRESWR